MLRAVRRRRRQRGSTWKTMRFATLETACLRAICCGKKATRCVGVSVCVCWCTHNTHTHTLTHTHTQVYQQAQKCQHMPLRMRLLEEARDLYLRAHKTDANSVAALTNLAAVDMALGDHEVAVGHCDDAIATAKRVRAEAKLLARAYERKGKALRACKRFKEALAAVREAHALVPSPALEEMIAEVEAKVKYDEEGEREEERAKEEKRRREEEEEREREKEREKEREREREGEREREREREREKTREKKRKDEEKREEKRREEEAREREMRAKWTRDKEERALRRLEEEQREREEDESVERAQLELEARERAAGVGFGVEGLGFDGLGFRTLMV